MAHPHWPLFDLEVHTPRLSMRYLDDDLGTELATLATRGIHDPGFMPFSMPWSDAASPDLERDALRFYWRSRAETRPTNWNLHFAVIEAGQVVGTTSVFATDFPVTRTFETGSWLGRAHQGRGLGTEMRVASLQLGFLGLDALVATTGAFRDNGPSLGVTHKLGYEPNGILTHNRRDAFAESERFRMGRDHFVATVQRDDIRIVGDEGVRELLGIRR
jgi:RimJ/RimL family protein N-acetyltransferase